MRTHNKCWKVLDDELPTQSTTVGHVGGVSGSDIYGGGGGVHTVNNYGDGYHAQNTALN